MRQYGQCEYCEVELEPIWFLEEEYETTRDGYMIRTGRTRMAVSHLECPCCSKRYCVDDSFDGPWR